jgi:replication-associated recombination protein RarA
MTLAIHPTTQAHINLIIENSPHAVLVTGSKGIGKLSIANFIASTIFNKTSDFTQHVRSFSAKDKNFGIETIEEIQKFLKTTHKYSNAINKIVVIDNLQELSFPAQNMILKTLEEPPAGSMLILCTPNKNMVLQTIVSRCQSLNIITPSKTELKTFFINQSFQDNTIDDAYKLSNGLPGLMSAILNQQDHPLKTATEFAKDLLTSSHFNKLCLIDALSSDKSLLSDVTYMLQQISQNAIQKSSDIQSIKWSKVLEAAYQADVMLSKNVNSKLVCNKLMLSL